MRFALLTKALADRTQTDLPVLAGYLAGRGHEVTIISGESGSCPAGVKLRPVAAGLRRRCIPGAFGVCALAELSRISTPDVLLTTSDSLALSYIAAVYKRVVQTRRCVPPRLVHFATTLKPEASVATGQRISPYAARLARSFATAGLCSADLVVVSGSDMQEQLLARHSRLGRPGRVRILSPWAVRAPCAPRRCDSAIARELSLEGRFVVLHHGGLGKGHDVAGLATAIELTSTDRRILWLMTPDGPSPEQLRKHHSTGQLHNVKFLPSIARLSREQLAALAHIHVVSQAEHMKGMIAPLHLAELMSWGKTIISLAPHDATSTRILRENHAGCVVPPGHGEILARTIWQLHDSPLQREVFGRAARYTFEKELCSDVVLPRLEHMLIEGLQS